MHPRVRLHRWTDAQWERQRALLEPVTGDLFADLPATDAPREPARDPAPTASGPPPTPARAPVPAPRRANYVQSWKR